MNHGELTNTLFSIFGNRAASAQFARDIENAEALANFREASAAKSRARQALRNAIDHDEVCGGSMIMDPDDSTRFVCDNCDHEIHRGREDDE